MPDSDDEKPVLYFRGKNKGLVLNVCNGQEIAEAYGDDMENWPGNPVVLYRTSTTFAGKRVPCLRIRVPAAPAPAPAPEPQPAPAPPLDVNAELAQIASESTDDVPF